MNGGCCDAAVGAAALARAASGPHAAAVPPKAPAPSGELYKRPDITMTDVMKKAAAAPLNASAAGFKPKNVIPVVKYVTPPVTPQQKPSAPSTFTGHHQSYRSELPGGLSRLSSSGPVRQ